VEGVGGEGDTGEGRESGGAVAEEVAGKREDTPDRGDNRSLPD